MLPGCRCIGPGLWKHGAQFSKGKTGKERNQAGDYPQEQSNNRV